MHVANQNGCSCGMQPRGKERVDQLQLLKDANDMLWNVDIAVGDPTLNLSTLNELKLKKY